MHPLSVGRFPHGLLVVLLLCVSTGFSEASPVAVVTSTTPTTRPCTTSPNGPDNFPTIDIDCTHRIEYVGSYSAEGTFSALARNRRWKNRAEVAVPTPFERSGMPLARPVEVPKFVDLHSEERVVENFAPPRHAVTPIHGRSQLASWRDRIITFAYGHEEPLLAPQHLTMDSRGRLIVTDPVAMAVHILDGKKSFRIAGGDRRRLQTPNGVAVDADDNIYVSDSDRGLVDVYDRNGTFLRYIGMVDDETLFDRPTGLAIDRRSGTMYLVDTPRNVLLVIDLRGNILKRVGRRSSDEIPVEFFYPSEVAVNGDEVLVLDRSGSRIQAFSLEGKLLREIKTNTWSIDGDPRSPIEMGMGTDAEGNIYLSNFNGSGVRIFTREGKLLNSFGKPGSQDGQFNSPTGVWVHEDNLYISDTRNRRVEVFKIHSLETEINKPLLASAP